MQFSSGNSRAALQEMKSMAFINQYAGEAKQLVSINGLVDADLSNNSTVFSLCLKGQIFLIRSQC